MTRARGKRIEKIKERVLRPGIVCENPDAPKAGIFGNYTPLNYAPSSKSTLRTIFSDAAIETHLAGLIRRQKDDGRWQTPWGISEGTRLEWDGIHTLDSLRILNAYGRIEGD